VSGIVSDSEVVVTADVGIPFEVRLAATPTTGDGWEVAALPPGVELLGSAAGTENESVFQLRAGHPGRFEVRFVAKRRWEQEPIEIRVVAVEAVAPAAAQA
jgi:Chagasin family peptidase inhibitor I42